MYVSKYYTNEEIDQRLLQGYFDDFVKAGFAGTINEFWAFVLSIANKVDKREGYDLSKNDFTDKLKEKLEGIEVPMSVFMEYTKVPIVIYYGDNLPETDERPELYEWTRRLYLMKIWAKMLNDLGGDVTVIHLPGVGLHGNTHFPMSDLNNIEVADLLSEWLHTKALD